MDLHLTNKLVIVTGGGRGIGEAICMAYAWCAGYPEVDQFRYRPNEREWPMRHEDCTADTPFVLHRITWVPAYGCILDDFGHLGAGRVNAVGYPRLDDYLLSRDTSIGFADGHAELRKADQIDFRAEARTLYGGMRYLY